LDPARHKQQGASSTASTLIGIIVGLLLGILLLAAAICYYAQKYCKKNDEFGRNGQDRGRSRARASANTDVATEPEHRVDLAMNQDINIYEAAEAEGSCHTIAYDALSSAADGNFGGDLVMNQAAHIFYEAAEAEGSCHTIAYDALSSAAEEQRRRSALFTEPVATQTKAANAAQHEKLTRRSRTNTALENGSAYNGFGEDVEA
jgi:hypothetical protein